MSNLKSTHIAVATVAAVVLAAGGAAFAANTLHGSRQNADHGGLAVGTFVSSGTASAGRSGSHEGHGPGDLTAAATYLGVTQSALVTSLQSGKTLAQVADATSGKSSAGLIDALVAAEKTELASDVTAGRLTQTQADTITATLKTRVTAQVNGTFRGGPGGPGHGPGRGGDDLAAAASYLGVTQSALVTSLQSGKTLAQVADATSGKSSAGLIDVLVAAEKTELAAAVKAGQLTQAQADSMTTDLKTRITAHVNDTHTGDDGDHHGPSGFGPGGPGGGFGGPGGPPPSAPSSGSNSMGGTHI